MNREARVGLFVLAALAVIAYFILNTTEVGALWREAEPRRQVLVALSDASGVREGTPVRVAGVKVGEVVLISLEERRALARINLPVSLELRDSAYAELRSQGVLGDRYLALHPGQGAALAADKMLTANTPPSLEDITSTIQSIGQDLKLITGNLAAATRNNAGDNRIALIAGNIEKLTQALVDMAADNRANLADTTANFAQLTGQMNRDIPTLVQEMTALVGELRAVTAANSGNIQQTTTNVADMTGKMGGAAASFNSIAEKVDKGEGSLGKLINDPTTVDNLNRVLVKAEESLGEVEKLINQVNDVEMDLHLRGELLPQPGANKTYVGITLRPDDNKYYMIEGVGLSDELLFDEIDRETETVFDGDGNLVSTIVRERVDEADEFEITGQLAYRFGDTPLFFRGGLIQGEGGGGMDYYAMQERLRFSLEGFDFSRDNDLSPHAKMDFRFKLNKNLTVNFGWDDFLESQRDAAYFGAGIRWKDEDLKLLFGQLGRAF